jgi:hypothetical protein
MKIFYALFILFQLWLAMFSRDQNRIAYLKYLWSSHMAPKMPSRKQKENSSSNSNYKETKSEATTYEYSILLER